MERIEKMTNIKNKQNIEKNNHQYNNSDFKTKDSASRSAYTQTDKINKRKFSSKKPPWIPPSKFVDLDSTFRLLPPRTPWVTPIDEKAYKVVIIRENLPSSDHSKEAVIPPHIDRMNNIDLNKVHRFNKVNSTDDLEHVDSTDDSGTELTDEEADNQADLQRLDEKLDWLQENIKQLRDDNSRYFEDLLSNRASETRESRFYQDVKKRLLSEMSNELEVEPEKSVSGNFSAKKPEADTSRTRISSNPGAIIARSLEGLAPDTNTETSSYTASRQERAETGSYAAGRQERAETGSYTAGRQERAETGSYTAGRQERQEREGAMTRHRERASQLCTAQARCNMARTREAAARMRQTNVNQRSSSSCCCYSCCCSSDEIVAQLATALYHKDMHQLRQLRHAQNVSARDHRCCHVTQC